MSHDPSNDEWSNEPTEERTDEWSMAVRDMFRRLPREKEPPPALEERLVRELRRRGHLRPAQRPWVRPLLRTAAAVLLLLGGALLGRWTEGAPGPEPGGETDRGPQFLLLLYEPPGWSEEEEPARVEEYGAWARGIAAQGRSVTGAPLVPARRVLVPARALPRETAPLGEPEGLTLGGYFLIGASDFDSAVKVAESCPHLRHGGTIVVRPLRQEP